MTCRRAGARFVTDVADCVEQARAAAGDRPVLAHGAGAAQALLRAGLLGELEIHLVHVLLGGGERSSTRTPPATSSSTWCGGWRRGA